MGLKIDGSMVAFYEVDITVGALMALTGDDKRMIEVNGERMRVKDAYGAHGDEVIEKWGFCGSPNYLYGFRFSDEEDIDGDPSMIWVRTRGK